ncbi:hypothetical protein [Gulosibacter sediminis]|uniref:hypothetical protein n=1 Tax=Gulosibacter sediminis TaxID=1729695 RepID=UPI0024A8858C|nr:hypothetical protein [Gulosibacter sediminis]
MSKHSGDEIVFRVPADRRDASARFFVRLFTGDRSKSATVKLNRHGETVIKLVGNLSFVTDDTILSLWSESDSGELGEVSARVRLSALLSLYDLTVDDLYRRYEPGNSVQQQVIAAFKLAQWVATVRLRSWLRVLSTKFQRYFIVPENQLRGSLLAEILHRLHADIADDRIVDVLLYGYCIAHIRTAVANAKWMVSVAMAVELRSELSDILRRIVARRTMPYVQSLVVSLTDVLDGRNAATQMADLVRAAPDTVDIPAEMGCLTYGLAGENSPRAPVEFVDIVGRFVANGTSIESILYSGNPEFIRAYAGRIMYFMTVFREYHFHFVLIADRDEALVFADQLMRLWRENASIKRISHSERMISISYCDLPEDVREPVTFFASARYYFVAQQLRKCSAGLWVHDVDLYPESDFRPVIRRALKEADVALSISPLAGGLIPWKRYLAGDVFFRSTDQACRLAHSIAQYLDEWVAGERSWMVDQNAIAYAVEKNPGVKLFNLLAAGIPLRQSAMASLLESSVQK